MSARPKYEEGQYNIECAICGCIMKSSQIVLAKESQLPVCVTHAEENGIRPRYKIPTAQVPLPTGQPADRFITYDTPDE